MDSLEEKTKKTRSAGNKKKHEWGRPGAKEKRILEKSGLTEKRKKGKNQIRKRVGATGRKKESIFGMERRLRREGAAAGPSCKGEIILEKVKRPYGANGAVIGAQIR